MDINNAPTPHVPFAGLAAVDPLQEAELLARWQEEISADATDADLPVPVTPIEPVQRRRR